MFIEMLLQISFYYYYFIYIIYFADPRWRKCPMNLALCVRPSVRLQRKISELANQFFLI